MAGMCSDPNSDKLFRAQILDHGDEPVVTTRPSLRANSDFSPGKVELIVYQNQILRSQTVLGHEWLERRSAQVHVSLRFRQDQVRSNTDNGFRIEAPDRNIPVGCEPVDHEKSQVMRRRFILLAW